MQRLFLQSSNGFISQVVLLVCMIPDFSRRLWAFTNGLFSYQTHENTIAHKKKLMKTA